MLKEPYHYFKDYWSETGNDIETFVALQKPETIFISDKMWFNDVSDFKEYVE